MALSFYTEVSANFRKCAGQRVRGRVPDAQSCTAGPADQVLYKPHEEKPVHHFVLQRVRDTAGALATEESPKAAEQ